MSRGGRRCRRAQRRYYAGLAASAALLELLLRRRDILMRQAEWMGVLNGDLHRPFLDAHPGTRLVARDSFLVLDPRRDDG